MTAPLTEMRSGPRYMVHINVRAEWDDERSGEHVVVDGETENIGPQGALVHLERLPDVGSRVQLIPAVRRLWIVTTKFSPVRTDENPVTNTPTTASATWLLE